MKACAIIISIIAFCIMIFSCKKDIPCSTNFRVKSISVKSYIEDDSFFFNYDAAGKIKEVTLNGLSYINITNLNDTEIQILDFTDTLSGTIDTVWCAVSGSKIQSIKKRFGTLYDFLYNSSGTIDTVKSYSGGEYYNYSFLDLQKNNLNYTQRYHTICGFNTPCSKYFRDSIRFEDNNQLLPMPDQFIYQDLSEIFASKGLPYKYLLELNGYFANFNKYKRISEWTGTYTPIFIPLDAARYAIKYSYTFNSGGHLSKMRTETFDETANLVFYKEYYFTYETLK